MSNGRPVPSSAPTVPNAIPFRSAAPAPGQLGRSSDSTALRLTRRGQIVRSTLIVIMILIIALVAGLFAGGISGLF